MVAPKLGVGYKSFINAEEEDEKPAPAALLPPPRRLLLLLLCPEDDEFGVVTTVLLLVVPIDDDGERTANSKLKLDVAREGMNRSPPPPILLPAEWLDSCCS